MINKAGADEASLSTIASVGHEYDEAGRRKNARREDGTRWDYGYNTRSEVTAAEKRTAAEALVPGLSYAYAYDGIGNRISSTSGTSTRGYTRNALNQYEAITHDGNFDILTRSDLAVTATPNAGVTVSGMETAGNLHGIHLQAANGTNGKLAVTTVKRGSVAITPAVQTWVPPANLTLTYDLDGNLLGDGRWTYGWDGENRLVSMKPVATALTAGAPNVELRFAYDWMGRRIGKTVVDSTPGASSTVHMSYSYDHWNPVAEWKRTSLTGLLSGTALQRTHLWGLDLGSSGRIGAGESGFQGAGGVGGLIASTYHTGTTTKDRYIPSYDANGNIIAWSSLSSSSSSTVVHSLLQRHDYDPFGNQILIERIDMDTSLVTLMDNIPSFGFSTKIRDEESNLCYYGYRYYDPVAGRWPSRDPFGVNGCLNIYSALQNGLLSKVDYLGLLDYCFLAPDFRTFNKGEGSRQILKIEGLENFKEKTEIGGATLGLTTRKIKINVTCGEVSEGASYLEKAEVKYGIIVYSLNTDDQALKNQIYWSERDHWVDMDAWFIGAGVPEAEKIEKEYLGRRFGSKLACETLIRQKLESMLVRTSSEAYAKSGEEWNLSGKHQVGHENFIKNESPIEPRAIGCPRCFE